jgi:hypothetical protein
LIHKPLSFTLVPICGIFYAKERRDYDGMTCFFAKVIPICKDRLFIKVKNLPLSLDKAALQLYNKS